MSDCNHCGAAYAPKQSTQRFCSASCRSSFSSAKLRSEDPEKYRAYQTAYSAKHAVKKREAVKRWAENNPEKVKANRLKNKPCKAYARKYAAHSWHKKRSPEADRVASMFENMNDRQRGRFADWLLRQGHRSLSVFKVDEFVSDHNTQGI